MDGLLLHDSFETYYAGKRKRREEKPVPETSEIPAKPEALTGRPSNWPLPRDVRPDVPVS